MHYNSVANKGGPMICPQCKMSDKVRLKCPLPRPEEREPVKVRAEYHKQARGALIRHLRGRPPEGHGLTQAEADIQSRNAQYYCERCNIYWDQHND